MLDNRRLNPFIAVFGALALLTAAPAAMAQEAEQPAAEAAVEAPADVSAEAEPVDPPTLESTMGTEEGSLTPWRMFATATLVVQVIMIGLLVAAALTWIITILKLFELGSLGRVSNRFVDDFRTAKSISDAGKIARSEDYDGNPLADMAAAAAHEVELSVQAGLAVGGAHRDSTIERAASAVHAVQSSLGKRLSSGMTFLASVGANSPFVGLFGTVFGIMNSFISIANTGTTNLAAVAPGIAEALLATAIGLFAAIPAVVMYNYFQTRITSFGARTESYISELMNFISRQLDKGA